MRTLLTFWLLWIASLSPSRIAGTATTPASVLAATGHHVSPIQQARGPQLATSTNRPATSQRDGGTGVAQQLRQHAGIRPQAAGSSDSGTTATQLACQWSTPEAVNAGVIRDILQRHARAHHVAARGAVAHHFAIAPPLQG